MNLSLATYDLEQIAPVMNTLQSKGDDEPHYDCLSDAIFWYDEIPIDIKPSLLQARQILRLILRYRTSLIEAHPDDSLRDVWEIAKQRFPKWIGFASERCQEDPRLAQIFRSMQDKFNKSLDEYDS